MVHQSVSIRISVEFHLLYWLLFSFLKGISLSVFAYMKTDKEMPKTTLNISNRAWEKFIQCEEN